MKHTIFAIIGMLSISTLSAETINLSPQFEKVLEDTARLMSKGGRRDFNKNITYLKKEYKKSEIECDFVVAAYDLRRQAGSGNNTIGFTKSQRYYYDAEPDNDAGDVFFIHEDEVISEDGKQIIFQRGDDEFKSCIYFKTKEKKEKEREARRQARKKSRNKED